MAGPGGSAWMRTLRKSSQHHRAWQMALAISLGLMLGLIPKANLLALVLAVVILILPIHTLLAIGSCALTSCLATVLMPIEDRLGLFLFQHPKTQLIWEYADSAPLLPWSGLNNSIVLGGLSMGLVIGYPLFLIAYVVFKRGESCMESSPADTQETAGRSLRRQVKPAEAPIVAESPENKTKTPITRERTPHTKHPLHWHMHSKPPERVDSRTQLATISRVAEPLKIKAPGPDSNADRIAGDGAADASILRFDSSDCSTAIQVAQRAEQLARWADEALADCLNEEYSAASNSHSTMERCFDIESSLAGLINSEDRENAVNSLEINAKQVITPRIYSPSQEYGPSPEGTVETSQIDSTSEPTLAASNARKADLPAAEMARSTSNTEEFDDPAPRISSADSRLAEQPSPTPDEDEHWLIETTIEVVRLAEHVVAAKLQPTLHKEQTDSMPSIPDLLSFPHTVSSPTLAQIPVMDTAAQRAIPTKAEVASSSAQVSAPTPTDGAAPSSMLERKESAHPVHRPLSIVPGVIDSASMVRHAPAQGVAPSGNREEALRYLLRHLREIREKV